MIVSTVWLFGVVPGVTVVGLKLYVVSAGKPETVNVTGLLKPPVGVRVIVSVPVPGAVMLSVGAEDAPVKLGGIELTV